MSSILKDDPPLVEELPTELNETLQWCLAKAPEARYQTGKELSEALSVASVSDSAAPAPTTSSEVPWIVVRLFKTRAADDELMEFAEGLAEDIVAGLALFSHLSVILPRTRSIATRSDSPSKEPFASRGQRPRQR